MLPTAPTTTLPCVWRLFGAADSDDERFVIAFLDPRSPSDWSCDEVARNEDEARAYAVRHGVSLDSFTTALERIRAGNAD